MGPHLQTADAANVWVGHCTEAIAGVAFHAAIENVLPRAEKPVRSVVIKVNLCDYRLPETGAVTDPDLLGVLVAALRTRFPDAGFHVIENDATSLEVWSAYRLLGFCDAARRYGFILHNAAEEHWIERPVPRARVFPTLEIPAAVHGAGLFVDFAKLKTNALTRFSGCIKNLFGLLRPSRKVVWHNRIDDVLLDLNRVLRPDLCVIDGVIGVEGIGGPAFGRPKRCDLLLAGVNPVSVDACAARIMGFRPRSIRHIRLCEAAGLGTARYAVRTDIEPFPPRRSGFRFERLEYLAKNLLRSRAGLAT